MRIKLYWFFFDRRMGSYKSFTFYLLISLFFFWTALAIADNTGSESLKEHSAAILSIEGWIIGGLFTLSGMALSYIYIQGQKATRSQITELVSEIKQMRIDINGKRDKTVCVDIRNECHKHLEEIVDLVKARQ